MPKLLSFLTSSRIWWGVLTILLLLIIGMISSVWLAGRQETYDAFNSGRRLIVSLADEKIQGKLIATEAKRPEEAPTETSEEAVEPAAEAVPEQEIEIAVTAAAVNPLPDVNPALSEKTKEGMLPVIGADGTKPWRYYAKPYERKGGQPMIAIIVTGLGQNRSVTERAIKLNEHVTLSFSPYNKSPGSWAKATRATAHELLIDVPMEPSNYPAADPGPYGLLVDKGETENQARLRWIISRFPTAIGFLTPQSENYTANADALKALLQTLANRGLIVTFGREPHRKETQDIVDATTTPNVIADVLLDEELSETSIQARFEILEQTAKARGYAIGIAQPYPITLDQLERWISQLGEKGFLLVPVSAIVHQRFS